MTNGQVETRLLGQRAGIRDDCQSVHLQLVVVVKAQRLIDPDTRVQLETALFQTMLASGMAGVQDGHIVLFCQCVDGGEQAHEVLFRVDVFLSVGRQQNILVLFQPQPFQHVAFLNLVQIHVQNLRHGRAGLVSPLLGQSGVRQILPGKLGVAQVHVGDHIHDAAVGLLGQALVKAAVSGLHMEDGNMQALGRNGRQAAVGVAQDQQGDADGGAQKDDLQRVTVQERRDDVRGNDIQNDLIDGRESAQRRAARGQLQREKP